MHMRSSGPFFPKIFMILLSSCFLIQCQTSKVNQDLIDGNQYAKDGLWREAIESYRRAVTANPENMTASRNLGMVLVRVGQYKHAVYYLEKAVAFFRDDFDVNYYLAEAFRGSDAFADAIFYYQKAHRLKPDSRKALRALAWSYFRVRYYSEALSTSKKLYQLAPRDSQTSVIMARTFLKLRRFKSALHTIRAGKGEASAHDLPYLESVEGDILSELKQYTKAAKLYRHALRKQPLLASALMGLGRYYLRQKKNRKAIAYLEKAAHIKPGLTEAQFLLGQAWEPLDSQMAIRCYQNFRRQAATDPEYLGMLSNVKKRIATIRKSGSERNVREGESGTL